MAIKVATKNIDSCGRKGKRSLTYNTYEDYMIDNSKDVQNDIRGIWETWEYE